MSFLVKIEFSQRISALLANLTHIQTSSTINTFCVGEDVKGWAAISIFSFTLFINNITRANVKFRSHQFGVINIFVESVIAVSGFWGGLARLLMKATLISGLWSQCPLRSHHDSRVALLVHLCQGWYSFGSLAFGWPCHVNCSLNSPPALSHDSAEKLALVMQVVGRGCVLGVLQDSNYWSNWNPGTFLPCVIPSIFTTISPPLSCCSSNLQSQCVLQPQQRLQTGPCGLWIHFLEYKRGLRTFEGQLVHKHGPEIERENQCVFILEAALNMGCSCWSSTFSNFFCNLWLVFFLLPSEQPQMCNVQLLKMVLIHGLLLGAGMFSHCFGFATEHTKYRNTLVNYKM